MTLVIGSGPSGQRAAIQSAKLHKRVAVIERKALAECYKTAGFNGINRLSA